MMKQKTLTRRERRRGLPLYEKLVLGIVSAAAALAIGAAWLLGVVLNGAIPA